MTEWIPFFQTLVWPLFVIGVLIYFRGTCATVLGAIAERIKSGAPVEAGPSGFKLGSITKEMERLPPAPPSPPDASKAAEPTDWRQMRAEEYKRVDGYMLVHVYRPSTFTGQTYDIFLFLVRHQKGTDGPPRRQFEEIEKVEFYFGESWGNKVFCVQNMGGVIGVRTQAWGTFLACCRITFKDVNKQPVVVFRYVDFQMLQEDPDADWRRSHQRAGLESLG